MPDEFRIPPAPRKVAGGQKDRLNERILWDTAEGYNARHGISPEPLSLRGSPISYYLQKPAPKK